MVFLPRETLIQNQRELAVPVDQTTDSFRISANSSKSLCSIVEYNCLHWVGVPSLCDARNHARFGILGMSDRTFWHLFYGLIAATVLMSFMTTMTIASVLIAIR